MIVRIFIQNLPVDKVWRKIRNQFLHLKYPMPTFGTWSRAVVALIVAMGGVLGGCGGGVQVIRESSDSGVVRYLYKGHDGHLSTSKREEALDKIHEFCRGQYQVLKEGKTKGRQRVVEGMGGTEIVTEDWWGIRFQCAE